MAAIDNTKKSARLLASRRYTHDTYTDSQEAFTSTLDINANEVYVDQSFIPSSSLPYSGSGQNGSIYTVDGRNVVKYWYRQPLTKSDLNNEVWFFLDPEGASGGIGAQIIDATQLTNFVSPKYAVPALANANTEDVTPGYGVKVFVSSNASTPSSGDQVSVNNYTFDYKTGVLQFTTSGVAPTAGQYVYITTYQYVGRVLSDNITNVSSSIAAISASVGGTGGSSVTSRLSALEISSGSLNSFTSSTNVRLNNLESTSASVNTSVSNLNIATASLNSKTGSYATTGSNVFNGNQIISGAVYITSDLVIYGSSSIQNISASNVYFGDNIITLNTVSPSIRFAGIEVQDSGSNSGITGSLLWDSLHNRWIYAQPAGSGASYNSAILINGPENSGSLGDEQTLTANYIPVAQESDHIMNSKIWTDGTITSIGTNVVVTGSMTVGTLNATNGVVSGSSQVDITGTTNYSSFSSSISASIQELSASVGSGAGVSITNLNTFSASVQTRFSTLSTYTASIDSQLSGLGTETASLEARFSTLATLTGSNLIRLTNLESTSASVNTSVSNINTLTASVLTQLSTLGTETASIETRLSTISTLTASYDSQFSAIATETASLETRFSTLATLTGSNAVRLTNLEATSASVNVSIANINSFSSSQLSKNSTLETYTSSLETRMGAIATETASIETRLSTISTLTASYNSQLSAIGTETASIETRFSTLATLTGSNSVRLTNLETTSASVNVSVSNINTFTSSANSRLTTLEGTGTIQGVGQGNEVTFAKVTTTGDVVVGGDLVVQGNTVTLNTATLVVEDKLISLASGSTNAAASNGAGIEVLGSNATITYQSTPDSWQFNKPITGSAITASLNVPSNGGNSKRIAFRGTTDNIEFISAPSTTGDLVQWDGTNFIMSNTIDGGSF